MHVHVRGRGCALHEVAKFIRKKRSTDGRQSIRVRETAMKKEAAEEIETHVACETAKEIAQHETTANRPAQ